MKKLSLLAVAVLTLAALTACSKKDKNNGYNPYGYAPNSCYRTGGVNQFRYVNGICVDSRTGQQTSPQNCVSGQMGQSYDPRCNFYGGHQLNNQYGYGMDACATAYGPGWVTSRGVYGELICVNSMTWNYISSYYGQTPIMMNGVYQTCIPGGSYNCRCQSFGGTLGWFQAGVSVGFCY
jgi:hypothetical protein